MALRESGLHATDNWLPGNAESEVRPRPNAEPPVTAQGPRRPIPGPSAPFYPTSGCWHRELPSGVLGSPHGVRGSLRRVPAPRGAGNPRPPSSYVSGVATCPAPRPLKVAGCTCAGFESRRLCSHDCKVGMVGFGFGLPYCETSRQEEKL